MWDENWDEELDMDAAFGALKRLFREDQLARMRGKLVEADANYAAILGLRPCGVFPLRNGRTIARCENEGFEEARDRWHPVVPIVEDAFLTDMWQGTPTFRYPRKN